MLIKFETLIKKRIHLFIIIHLQNCNYTEFLDGHNDGHNLFVPIYIHTNLCGHTGRKDLHRRVMLMKRSIPITLRMYVYVLTTDQIVDGSQ